MEGRTIASPCVEVTLAEKEVMPFAVHPRIVGQKVDFPAPFAPVSAAFVPVIRFTETFFKISRSPNAKET